MGVVSSVGAVSSLFLVPCLLSLQLLKLSWPEAGICVVLCLLSLVLSGVGLYASVEQLAVGGDE